MIRRRSGFTLMEVMIAFLFLGVAIIPISFLLESIYSSSSDSRNSGIATFLAQKNMEELISLGYTGLPPGTGATYTYAPLADFSYMTSYYQISPDSSFDPVAPTPHTGSPGPVFKRIKVVVYWGNGLEGERVELVRVMGNY